MNKSRRYFGVISLAFALVFSPGCDDSALKDETFENHHEIIRLTQQVELLEFRHGIQNSRANDELEQENTASADIALRLIRLKAQRDALKSRAELLESQLSDLRQESSMVLRRAMCGTKLERMVIRNRKTYQDVHILDVSDAGVSIRHRDGAATLRFADLTPEQQMQFGLNESGSLAAEKQEICSRIAYDSWVDSQIQASCNDTLVNDGIQQSRKPLGPLRSETTPPSPTSLLGAPAKTFGKGNIYRYGTSRRYRYYYYYQIHPPFTPPPCQSQPVTVFSSFLIP